MRDTTKKSIIGEIVAADYRTAAVFENFGIDFCCKGNKSIGDVCEAKNINANVLIERLDTVINLQENKAVNYQSWHIDLLADYIEKNHHRYVQQKIPVINQYLDKLCGVHGLKNPELFGIREQFNHAATELLAHMKKEEMVLFPFIRQLFVAQTTHQTPPTPHFGTVQNPVQMMMHEHDIEGERFRTIAQLSNNYTPPADACNTYKVTYALLKEFETDLHLHIHLENNILFPKAIAMEDAIVAIMN